MKPSPEVHSGPASLSRRDFLGVAGGAAVAPFAGAATAAAQAAPAVRPASASARRGRPNLLFVFADQERYPRHWPKALVLPAHERLRRRGVNFHNHYCPAVMCTSSRAVLLTGLQTADNRMFENADMPYVKALSPEVPTIGQLLRKAGYYTAYQGKWHLNKEFEDPGKLLTREMDAYGFSDFAWPWDGLAHGLGGYRHDHLIAGSAVAWLRDRAQGLAEDGQPWSLFVSLVNPHDIMYFNADARGEHVQDTGKLMMHATRAPDHAGYRRRWSAPLPASLREPLDAPGRPRAHQEFHRAWGYTLGTIPPEPARWNRFNDFYFNSLSAVDAQLGRLLDELDALGLADNTIVVYTSDHGELGGAHGLRGKGPFAYQEAIHLPLMVSHPDVRGGQDCASLTGHIDIVPTLLSMCGVDAGRASELAGRRLPGHDFSPVLNRPGTSGVHAIRDSVLFTYSGIATNDAELIRIVSEAKAAGQEPKAAVQAAGYRPDMRKRGSLRCVFDGRYKFTRYFAPVDRHRPGSLDELYRLNDVELFDLQADPGEMNNLAAHRTRNAELIQRMSAKLEAIIEKEIGVDDGREMPRFEGVDWSIDSIDL